MTTLCYQRLRDLPIRLEGIGLRGLSLEGTNGWTRRTTEIELHGDGHVGRGEDVGWNGAEQERLQGRDLGELHACCGGLEVASFGEFLDALDRGEVLAGIDERPDTRLYRRWAFESAGLDLALRQSKLSLATAIDREPRPTRFVSSAALAGPNPLDNLRGWLEHQPGLRLKVDFAPHFDEAFCAELASLDVVDVIDLKGLYRGTFSGPPADPVGYARIAAAFPAAWIEDPDPTHEAAMESLAEAMPRVTWDANLHALADVIQRAIEPRAINIKPSRFGFLRELLAVYSYCESRGIAMYGGGQFELGVGRRQIQLLASLFHPDGPNDVAPLAFHDSTPRPDVPASPLTAEDIALPAGF